MLVRRTMLTKLARFGAVAARTPRTTTRCIVNAASQAAANYPDAMDCRQCAQTSNDKMCAQQGVCGKQPGTSALQDAIIGLCGQFGAKAHAVESAGGTVKATDKNLYLEAQFSTLTNVNFDDARMLDYITRLASSDIMKTPMLDMASVFDGYENWETPGIMEDLDLNEDVKGLHTLCTHGIKGTCAYFYHAEHTRQANGNAYTQEEADAVYSSMFELQSRMISPQSNDMLGAALDIGALNTQVMKLLSDGHRANYGIPELTSVSQTMKEGPAILVSGHDLCHLQQILEQTAGKGINVYSHGEILPAHGYPAFKAFDHFVGHYGGAWMDQQDEFKKFPGAIVMTSNCIMPPKRAYKKRLFTCGPVGFDGLTHVNGDFGEVIEAAFSTTGETPPPAKEIFTGAAHEQVLALAGPVIDAIQAGKIKNIFLVGGCDGGDARRSYFTDFVAATPEESLVLTLGCGKFRFANQDLGSIDGIPRYIDMGQCNDAYSAVVVASALAEALNTDIHSLPLHFAVSWFEQKAISVFLSLLQLNIQNIHLGPNLPGFLTPNLVNALVEKFGVKLAAPGNEKADVAKMVGYTLTS